MKQDPDEAAIHDSIRPRYETSQKKKLIAFIKKQKGKKQELHGYKKKKKLVGYSEGQWTLRQLKLYHRYLSTHKNQFTDPQLRKRNKVFIKLADFIGSRTPDQCRSHHQKATYKFPEFQKLLANYETKIYHLSKLYEDINQASIRERERSEERRMREEEHALRQEEESVVEKSVQVDEQKVAKMEEKEDVDVREEAVEGGKVQKATGEVVSRDFFEYWLVEGNRLCILIQDWAFQQFN